MMCVGMEISHKLSFAFLLSKATAISNVNTCLYFRTCVTMLQQKAQSNVSPGFHNNNIAEWLVGVHQTYWSFRLSKMSKTDRTILSKEKSTV